MVQLWVNLPASAKMSPPRYQEILDASIPRVELENGSGVGSGSWGINGVSVEAGISLSASLATDPLSRGTPGDCKKA